MFHQFVISNSAAILKNKISNGIQRKFAGRRHITVFFCCYETTTPIATITPLPD